MIMLSLHDEERIALARLVRYAIGKEQRRRAKPENIARRAQISGRDQSLYKLEQLTILLTKLEET